MPNPLTENRLEIRRHFAASPARLFAAWTEEGFLARWFAPTDAYVVTVLALDLRVGGAYRIELRHEKGNVHTVAGVYREVSSPDRLAFTMRWEDDPGATDTLVQLEFKAAAGGTDFTLLHLQFADRDRMLQNEQGWTGCLERLARTC